MDVVILKELVHEGKVIAQIRQLSINTVMASWDSHYRISGSGTADWFPSVKSAQIFIRGWVIDKSIGKWRTP